MLRADTYIISQSKVCSSPDDQLLGEYAYVDPVATLTKLAFVDLGRGLASGQLTIFMFKLSLPSKLQAAWICRFPCPSEQE